MTDGKARVRKYVASLPPATRRSLKTLHAAIRAAAPRAEETISYGIPAMRLEGRVLIWFAGWKEHVSLYPMTGRMRRAFSKDIGRYETSKGTIKFPLTTRVPSALVKRLVKARVAELRGK